MLEYILVAIQVLCVILLAAIGVIPSLYPMRDPQTHKRTKFGYAFIVLVVISLVLVVLSGVMQVSISRQSKVSADKNKFESDSITKILTAKIDSCNSRQDDASVISRMTVDQLTAVNNGQNSSHETIEKPQLALTPPDMASRRGIRRNPEIFKEKNEYAFRISLYSANQYSIGRLKTRFSYARILDGKYKFEIRDWINASNYTITHDASSSFIDAFINENIPYPYYVIFECKYTNRFNDYNDNLTMIYLIDDAHIGKTLPELTHTQIDSIISALYKK